MKEFLIILFVLTTVISVGIIIYLVRYITIMPKLYYIEHVSTYGPNPRNHGKIIFIGDSETEFYKTSIYFNDYPVLNMGIAGDTTDGVLKRLHQNVILNNPKKVFLQIGTNDFGKRKKKEYILNNIFKIVQIINKELPETKVYVISIYPVNSRVYNFSKFVVWRRKNKDIEYINNQLSLNPIGAKYTYIDIAKRLKNSLGDLAKQYTVEGLHLNSNAYNLVSEILLPYIKE